MFMHSLRGNSLFCLHGNGSFPGSSARDNFIATRRGENEFDVCV